MSKLTTHQRKARDLIQREDWEGALAELQRVLSLDADNPTLHNQIGDVHLRKGDVDQACDHFEMAVDLYSTLGLHNNAVALCRKVVRLAPTRVEVRYHLARLRMDQGLRNEAGSAFSDYLDHVKPQDDEAANTFESRCVEVVESFPDIAPVGQILEKLEAMKRPQGAYRIVQRAAQRAADNGDSAAAKRLTEKMRSLRVLLESQGASPAVDEVAVETESTDAHEAPVDRTDSEPADSGNRAGSGDDVVVEVSRRAAKPSYTDPGAIELPAAGGDATSASPAGAQPPPVELPEPVASQKQQAQRGQSVADDATAATGDGDVDVPEIALDAVDSLEDSAAAFDSESRIEDGARGADAQTIVPGAPSSGSSDVESDTREHLDNEHDSTMPEYELPETSLEEVARLLQQEGVQPTVEDTGSAAPVAEPAGESPDPEESVDEDTRLLQDENVAANASEAATIAETFADPPEVDGPTTVGSQSSAAAQDDDDRPASVVYEPVPGRPRSGGSQDDVRRQPVWIPSPDTVSEDPTPSEEGQTQELEEVIDTFREQMARALGDDGAARYDLGVAYYDMGLYNEALAEFEVAVKCPGLANRTLEMMAACLAQQGRHDEVVTLLAGPLAESDKPTPERLALQYAMGLALEAVGQQEDARRHFEEVALVDIGFKDVQSRLQR